MEEQKVTQLIPDYIHSIPLPLNMNGKITFSVFPKTVIHYALTALARFQKQNPEDRAKYLYGICRKYCKDQHIDIRYDWSYKLKEQCNIKKDAKFTRELTSEEYKQQAQTLLSCYSHGDATHCDASTTQPGSSTHQSNTINGKADMGVQQDSPSVYEFIAQQNREMLRKQGADLERYDELRELYRKKRLSYRRSHKPY